MNWLLKIICLSGIIFLAPHSFAQQMPNNALPDDLVKIVKRNAIENEARRLFKRGLYEEAIQKYKDAIAPKVINDESEKSFALWSILEINQRLGKLGLAFQELQWFLQRRPDKDEYLNKKFELLALIEAEKTRSNAAIYKHIQYLKEKYKKELPPKKYWFHTTSITSTIIRLYDHIGDSDGGIAFVDQILAYKKLRPKARSEYLKVREAFEQDKKEGFKGCLDAKPGTVCMGRATQALIQSDYFPW